MRLHPWYLWPWIRPELKANSCLILTRLRNPKSKLMGRKWTNMSVIYVTKCFSGLKIWQNIENVWCALPLPNTNESNVIEIRYLQSLIWIQPINRDLYLPCLYDLEWIWNRYVTVYKEYYTQMFFELTWPFRYVRVAVGLFQYLKLITFHRRKICKSLKWKSKQTV